MVWVRTPKIKAFTTGSALPDVKHLFLAWWLPTHSPKSQNSLGQNENQQEAQIHPPYLIYKPLQVSLVSLTGKLYQSSVTHQ